MKKLERIVAKNARKNLKMRVQTNDNCVNSAILDGNNLYDSCYRVRRTQNV